jgi:hypothetical protein
MARFTLLALLLAIVQVQSFTGESSYAEEPDQLEIVSLTHCFFRHSFTLYSSSSCHQGSYTSFHGRG